MVFFVTFHENERKPRTKHWFWGSKCWVSWENWSENGDFVAAQCENLKIWVSQEMLVLSLLHVASRLLSCFVAVLPMPIGKAAKPFIFECLKRGYKVVLRGRHGILWDSDVFEKVLPVVLCDRRRRAWNVTFRGFQFGKMNWWTDDELTMNWRNWLESNYVKLDARRKTLPHPRVPATTPFFGPRLPPPSTPAATCFKQPLTEASEQIRTAWKNRSMFKQNLIILDSWFMLIHVDSCWFMLILLNRLS